MLDDRHWKLLQNKHTKKRKYNFNCSSFKTDFLYANFIPNGDGTMEPIVACEWPNLNRYDAAIIISIVEFAPRSLSVAFNVAINSFNTAFLLMPA